MHHLRTLLPLSLSLLLSLSASLPAATPTPHPNIVFIFADDWGWGDLSSHGHPWLKTPHLDRLAREGTDFHQFNVLNPVCSPSRTAAMTGMFPSRFGISQHFAAPAQNLARNMPDWLDTRAPSVARFFQQAGYRTAHFGKWHLTNRNTHGAPTPTAYGFDEFTIFNGGAETASADLHATPENAVKFIAGRTSTNKSASTPPSSPMVTMPLVACSMPSIPLELPKIRS
ncbi:MAG: sulfatase-like hydrolase/transferase [Verrucomicrobia bacterium]|nr:sulfatase-like hydrolase/transferase [Verrucomicrobiota bacterium]